MLIRISLEDMEWGLCSDHIPTVGDIISLPIARPDYPPDENISVKVCHREWCLSDTSGWCEEGFCIKVEALEDVPDGWIAHSPLWPSEEASDRKNARKIALREILAMDETEGTD